MNITPPITVSNTQTQAWTSTQQFGLGQIGYDKQGKKYRYCKAGAADLQIGKLYQAPAPVANHQALVTAAAAVGATTIVSTLGATAAAENDYAEGTVTIYDLAGKGYQYGVASHAAVLSAGVLTAYLTDGETVQVALTTTTLTSFQWNPYKGVIIMPTTATASPVGIAVAPIVAANFGWIGVSGVFTALIDASAPGVTSALSASVAVTGAVGVNTSAYLMIGSTLVATTSAKYGQVLLNLP